MRHCTQPQDDEQVPRRAGGPAASQRTEWRAAHRAAASHLPRGRGPHKGVLDGDEVGVGGPAEDGNLSQHALGLLGPVQHVGDALERDLLPSGPVGGQAHAGK
jgi:hypothetical protein